MIAIARQAFLLCAAGAVLAGCDTDSGPDLSGLWIGSFPGQCGAVVTISITRSERGIIEGSASLQSPVSCGFSAISYSMTGEHDHPRVTMTFHPVSGQGVSSSLTLSGTVDGADVIEATIDETSVTLVRTEAVLL